VDYEHSWFVARRGYTLETGVDSAFQIYQFFEVGFEKVGFVVLNFAVLDRDFG
jgi:hypothetical protein